MQGFSLVWESTQAEKCVSRPYGLFVLLSYPVTAVTVVLSVTMKTVEQWLLVCVVCVCFHSTLKVSLSSRPIHSPSICLYCLLLARGTDVCCASVLLCMVRSVMAAGITLDISRAVTSLLCVPQTIGEPGLILR